MTDQPQEQIYYNNSGIMMDRNLGAISVTEISDAYGLLYYWGRKDPFLPYAYESSSSIIWPSPVSSDSSCGTIAYATANPTASISGNSNTRYDWYYNSTSSTSNTRWKSSKTIYDPCPAGWRVPDGGNNGVWSNALRSSSADAFGYFYVSWLSNAYLNYPNGYYWSVTPNGSNACGVACGSFGISQGSFTRDNGCFVRCIKENNAVKSEWGISGTFSNWGEQSDITMSIDGAYSVAIAVNLPRDAEFKFRKNNNWDTNYGASSVAAIDSDVKQTAVSFGSNIKMKGPGVYDIYLSNDGKSFYVMKYGNKP